MPAVALTDFCYPGPALGVTRSEGIPNPIRKSTRYTCTLRFVALSQDNYIVAAQNHRERPPRYLPDRRTMGMAARDHIWSQVSGGFEQRP